jgi:hypothetical protein
MGNKFKKIENGTKFNRLTVISDGGISANNKSMCNTICECGNIVKCYATELRSGHIKSCGCLRKEVSSKRMTTHGYTKNKNLPLTFVTWCSMKQRCLDSNCNTYQNYGAKGVTICKRWIDSYEDFLSDMGERPSKEYSIDRINNKGNYEPSNCRWATQKEQMNNVSTNRIVNFNDENMTVSQASENSSIPYQTLLARLNSKNKDLFNKNIRVNSKKIILNIETGIYYESMSEAAKSIGIKPITFMKSIQIKGHYKSFNNAF